LRRIFDAGHVIHDVIQGALSGDENFISEVPVKEESTMIYGHCDGVLSDSEGLEIKSISTKGFQKLSGPKKEHKVQATMYGHILGLRSMTYLYMDKSSGQIGIFSAALNPRAWNTIALRAEKIIAAVSRGVLPPKIEKAWECTRCPFKWTCKP